MGPWCCLASRPGQEEASFPVPGLGTVFPRNLPEEHMSSVSLCALACLAWGLGLLGQS